MAAISELFQRCQAQFNSTVKFHALSNCLEVPLQEWRDELGRFRVWAANIGAHQTHLSSLEYRLRDASHIKIQVVTLLNQIQELLTDLKDVLEEQNDKRSQTDASDCLESPPGHEKFTPEIQEIHQGLVETNTQLYQISMIIRKPSQHDRLVGTDKLDSQPFRFWARQHASDKYPSADTLAIDRISSAMAQQRGVLKYRERHHTKLSQGIDLENDGKSTILSETVVTDLFEETPGQLSDMISEAGMSETSYGGTLLEGSGVNAPKIPPLPKKGGENQPFECPYCFYIITARDKRSWARHIFRDLMPYVCIFPGCSTPNKLYESRREWYHHIKQAHDSILGTNETYDCAICRQCTLPTANFQRHVGQHLEELALFLLPRTESESDSDEKKAGSFSSFHMSDASPKNYPAGLLVKEGNDMKSATAVTSDSAHSGSGRYSTAILTALEGTYPPVPISRQDMDTVDHNWRSLLREFVRDEKTERRMEGFLNRLDKGMKEKLAENEAEVMEEIEEEMEEIEKMLKLEKPREVVLQQEEAGRENINEIEEEKWQNVLEEVDFEE
ncbi:hypothetical protein N7520_002405 [Penicillium odoratum]|uniref:uncharacterized protein n=1 Tax=Penicillium odoratum TaxID=1167516 RepID=UPI002547939A|nr:uncharacterized protein N7520_002405 [Penicillium odoratum]KAJ5771876.1 hypothetical protein N7520_002405 [Penicillium odoratum]